MTGKKATPAPERRYAQALELFEKAVRAVGRKDHERARELLDSLISSYPEERELLERARSYRAACDRVLDKRPVRLKTFEELLNYGVFLHNRGEFQDALKYLHQAAEIHPRNEHVLYCLAAAAARAGDTAAALKALRSAIHANSASRAQARGDADFDGLRGDGEFLALVRSQAS